MAKIVDKLEDAGIEVVYEEYINMDTTDFSPYLTRVKHANPDCFYISLNTAQFQGVARQIVPLGGLGDTQVAAFGTSANVLVDSPGADGWIVISPWNPSFDDPEDIARAARSGDLEFDTPMGRVHFGTDGINNVGNGVVQIKDGENVLYAR